MTLTTPSRLMTLHFLHIGFTEALTFILTPHRQTLLSYAFSGFLSNYFSR